MTGDLNLVGMDYNIALTTFFVSYALFEVPSNIILKLIRPGLWVRTISVLFFVALC